MPPIAQQGTAPYPSPVAAPQAKTNVFRNQQHRPLPPTTFLKPRRLQPLKTFPIPIMKKTKILYLCTGNSCRSQMAEGWTRALKGDLIEVYSAGLETHGLNPTAVRVMNEAGVDISGQRSQHLDEFMDIDLDYVITVCDHAHETCPHFPRKATVIHHQFDDPPKLSLPSDTDEIKTDGFRRVRDEIKAFIQTLPESLDLNL